MGGYSLEVRQTKHSIKRHWQEIFNIGAGLVLEPVKGNRPLLSFINVDLYRGKSNDEIPLIISADMAKVEVKRILVDQGSSIDILFKELLPKLKMSQTDLSKHDGTDFITFKGSQTTPIGYTQLQVTNGDDKSSKKLNTNFPVLPCSSPYHCILSRPSLGRLGVMASTIHLKMRFYSEEEEVVTIPANLDLVRRC